MIRAMHYLMQETLSDVNTFQSETCLIRDQAYHVSV